MDEIGVRTLRASLSDVLRRVSEGHQVRVTVRGRPVADIVPPGAACGDLLQSLVADGRVSPALRSRPARAPRLGQPERSASDLVLSDREAEG